jgi:hypothetical protein
MARTKTKPEPVVEDNGDRDYSDIADRNPSWQAVAFAKWLKEEAEITITAKQVQAVTSLRVPFRQSEFYAEAKDEAQADQETETEPAAEAPKPKRSRTAKAKAEPAKATRTRRSRTKSPEPEVTVGKDDEAPKATRSRRTRRTKATTDEASTTPEAPF